MKSAKLLLQTSCENGFRYQDFDEILAAMEMRAMSGGRFCIIHGEIDPLDIKLLKKYDFQVELKFYEYNLSYITIVKW